MIQIAFKKEKLDFRKKKEKRGFLSLSFGLKASEPVGLLFIRRPSPLPFLVGKPSREGPVASS
jgi:hypothetical protein